MVGVECVCGRSSLNPLKALRVQIDVDVERNSKFKKKKYIRREDRSRERRGKKKISN